MNPKYRIDSFVSIVFLDFVKQTNVRLTNLYVSKINFKQWWLAALMSKGRVARGVSDTTDKFAGMTIASRRQSLGQPKPPTMKAGVQWTGESGGMFLRPTQQFPHGRNYPRKVVG